MQRLARAALAVIAATSAITLAGCPQSPGSICQHMVDSIDGMYMRCGYNLHVRLTFDGGATSTDCGHVTRVTDPNRIVHQCIPWADGVACESLVLDGSGFPQLDPSCDFSLLEGRP
ncbi:MAG: hypothetical protein U0234_23665 [Sandaracinus sp.]